MMPEGKKWPERGANQAQEMAKPIVKIPTKPLPF